MRYQRAATRIHPLGDLVVFLRGLVIRRLFGFDEFALEERNVLGVVELDHVERAIDRLRNQRADDEHVRIPLDHHVRVIREPDRAVRRRLAAVVIEHRLVPAVVRLGTRARKSVVDAHELHRRPIGELPF